MFNKPGDLENHIRGVSVLLNGAINLGMRHLVNKQCDGVGQSCEILYLQLEVQIVNICHKAPRDKRTESCVPISFFSVSQPRIAAYLMGVNVSKPLTALHGSPFFLTSSWRLRAVISTANAVRRCPSSMLEEIS